jgi:hypothetical protein
MADDIIGGALDEGNIGLAQIPETLAEALLGDKGEILETILGLTDPLAVVKRHPMDDRYQDGYSAVVHAKICRFKLLGMSDKAAAAAAGVGVRKLSNWTKKYPGLEADMAQAEQLTVAEVARMLMEFMGEKGMVGFQAVKYFLSTHSDTFKEESTVNVRTRINDEEVADAVRKVYGIEMHDEHATDDSPGDGESDSQLADLPA